MLDGRSTVKRYIFRQTLSTNRRRYIDHCVFTLEMEFVMSSSGITRFSIPCQMFEGEDGDRHSCRWFLASVSVI